VPIWHSWPDICKWMSKLHAATKGYTAVDVIWIVWIADGGSVVGGIIFDTEVLEVPEVSNTWLDIGDLEYTMREIGR
jgi:hypothetical protein